MCPAAVLWCSGSHIYGVSEGQWGLLPGSARRLCRRVNGQTCHRPDTLEPQEGPGELAGPGHLPEPATTRPGWGNSTRCTLPSSASAWPESRWNQPCFFSFFPPFLSFYPEGEGFWVVPPIVRPFFQPVALKFSPSFPLNLEGGPKNFLGARWTFLFDIPSEFCSVFTFLIRGRLLDFV